MSPADKSRIDLGVTGSGEPVAVCYGPEHAPDAATALGQPAGFPFTRGVQPEMYRSRLWTMRQYAGFGSASETNARFRYLLAQGQSGLSTAFDLPTQMGLDSDDPMAAGEVGRTGVAIDTLADMEELFAGIDLGAVSTSMTINAPAAVLLAMYRVVGERQGVDPARLSGTTQNDILKEYIARNTYIFPPAPSMRLVTDIFAHCAAEMPRWNTISISGYHMREAGCTAIQEVAFTLANARAYVEAALARGLDVDAFAPQLSFFFCAWTDVLEEVAKFRAARRIWARMMQERFGARNPKSLQLRFHTQTAGSSLTAQQPENNIVRTTLSALAAVLGGTQSLHTNAQDEALALPTEATARTALRVQQLLAYESGATASVDPLGGSYYVEALTDRIEEGVRDYFLRIDAMGGALAAIDAGFFQAEIHEAAYRFQKAVEGEQRVIVGVNRFTVEDEPAPDLQRIDPEAERRQVARLEAVRASRDASAVAAALASLEQAARGDANLMPPILDAVRSMASVGEICGVLKGVFGKHRPRVNLT